MVKMDNLFVNQNLRNSGVRKVEKPENSELQEVMSYCQPRFRNTTEAT
jgi:hypothetical protein